MTGVQGFWPAYLLYLQPLPAQAALVSDNPTQTVSVNQGLEANWSESHGIIRHEREPAIEFTAEQEQILNKPRLCTQVVAFVARATKRGRKLNFSFASYALT